MNKWAKRVHKGGHSATDVKQAKRVGRKVRFREGTTKRAPPLSAQAEQVWEIIAKIDRLGVIDDELAATVVEYMNNTWRQGNAVHGRSYSKQSKSLAMSTVLSLKGLDFIRRAQNMNHVSCLPHRHTFSRRVEHCVAKEFGIQPESTFRSCSVNLPHVRVHCCNDEVAVNQKVVPMKVDSGYMLAGLSNTCSRERCPGAMQNIIRQQDILVLKHGEVEQTIPLDALPEISKDARATQVCVWLLLCATRQSTAIFAGAIPTVGDLTMTDDALFLHHIIQGGFQAGLTVSFYGADNASPHALLSRGIVRSLSATDLSSLENTLKQRCEESGGTLTSADLESLAIEMMPIHHRRVSVLS